MDPSAPSASRAAREEQITQDTQDLATAERAHEDGVARAPAEAERRQELAGLAEQRVDERTAAWCVAPTMRGVVKLCVVCAVGYAACLLLGMLGARLAQGLAPDGEVCLRYELCRGDPYPQTDLWSMLWSPKKVLIGVCLLCWNLGAVVVGLIAVLPLIFAFTLVCEVAFLAILALVAIFTILTLLPCGIVGWYVPHWFIDVANWVGKSNEWLMGPDASSTIYGQAFCSLFVTLPSCWPTLLVWPCIVGTGLLIWAISICRGRPKIHPEPLLNAV